MKPDSSQVSSVSKRPNIPVPIKGEVQWRWVRMWVLSMIVIVLGLIALKMWIFKTIKVPLNRAYDLDADIQGCDVHFQKTYHEPQLRLSYWSFLGGGSVFANTTSDKLTVKAEMAEKMVAFRCLMTVLYGDETELFNSVNLKIAPDVHALVAPQPSNIAEMIMVSAEGLNVKEDVSITVSTMSITTLTDVTSGSMTVDVQGGTLEVKNWESTADGELSIDAKNALVSVKTEGAIAASLSSSAQPLTSLAAEEINMNKTEGKYNLTSGSGGKVANVHVHAQDCPVYMVAADAAKTAPSGDSGCPSLQTEFGDAVLEGPSFTTQTKHSLNDLRAWLELPGHPEFLVYIHFPMPNAPHGILKLLSTSYFSPRAQLLGVSIISGGLLQPHIVRILAPLTGVYVESFYCENLAPGDLEYKNEEFGKSMVSMTETHWNATLRDLGLLAARWVWHPHDEPSTIFNWQPAKNGRAAMWITQKLSNAPSPNFLLMAAITIGIGISLGTAIFCLLLYVLVPHLLGEIRSKEVYNTASYRLTHTTEANTWVISTTFIQWPMHGMLLRWRTRPMDARFATLTITARPWPIGDAAQKDTESIVVSGITNYRLPTYPKLPDQRCFLFAAHPLAGKNHAMPWFPDKFDTELYAVGLQQAGREPPQPPLHAGTPYQVRIAALDGTGTQLDLSQWSRPTVTQPSVAFVEYPLLLLRGFFQMQPDNTFLYFLTNHCLPITYSPQCLITLSEIKLNVINDSFMFCGALPGTYGDETIIPIGANPALYSDQVTLEFYGTSNTGSLEGFNRSLLYESTHMTRLPTQLDRQKHPEMIVPFKNILPGKEAKGLTRGLGESKFVVLDYKDDTVCLPIPYDKTQMLCIEAVTRKPTGPAPETAKTLLTWASVVDAVKANSVVASRPGATKPPPAQQINELVLRDGLTPCAILTAKASFSNSVASNILPPWKTADLPDVFEGVMPGMTYIWGESLYLPWKKPDRVPDRMSGNFSIWLVSETITDGVGSDINMPGKVKQSEDCVCESVSIKNGGVSVILAPARPRTDQLLKCYLVARNADAPRGRETQGVARSWDFVISRPVTMAEVEYGYGTFCIRNRINMMECSKKAMTSLYVEFAERSMNVCKGYRSILPIPAEVVLDCNDPKKDKVGPPLVENPPSTVITNGKSLVIPVDPPASEKAAAGNGKKVAPTKSSSRSSLSAPLLEGGEEGETVAKPTTKEAIPHTQMMVLPTNLFWVWDASWSPEVLLSYGAMPPIACDGWLAMKLKTIGLAHVGRLVVVVDDVVRITLSILVFAWQLIFLILPAIFVVIFDVYYELVRASVQGNITPGKASTTISLTDFLVAPDSVRWQKLEASSQAVAIFFLSYLFIATFMCGFSNFFRSGGKTTMFFRFCNTFTLYAWSASVFLLVLVFTVIALWILLGAIVNPTMLLPYAIMILAIVVLVKSCWGKLATCAEVVMSGIAEKFDTVLMCIMDSFAFDPKAIAKIDDQIAAIEKTTATLLEYMIQAERGIRSTLFTQTKILNPVPKLERDRMDTLRSSSYFTTLEGMAKNVPLATDFIPAAVRDAVLDRAQKIVTTAATISGTAPVAGMLQMDPNNPAAGGAGPLTVVAAKVPDITDQSLAKAIAASSGALMPKPGDIAPSETLKITELAQMLNLRHETATSIYNGYIVAMATAQQSDEVKLLSNPVACSALFCKIRHQQLFDHFVEKEQPSGVKHSNAAIMLHELQHAEVLALEAGSAEMLTKSLNWTTISRNCSAYLAGNLAQILTCTTDKHLNPVVNNSAAFKVLMKVYEMDVEFAKNPAKHKVGQMAPFDTFVEAGLIDQNYVTKEKTRAILQQFWDRTALLVSETRLLAAMRTIILPDEQLAVAAEGDDAPQISYLWWGALIDILKDLGWSDEEMEEKWLRAQWDTVTFGTGLFRYEGLDEVNLMIMKLTGGGLWKAAAKSMMLVVRMGGYLGCDIVDASPQVVSEKKKTAVALAKKLLYINTSDLKSVDDGNNWPQYVLDTWNLHGKEMEGVPDLLGNIPKPGIPGPTFMPAENIEEFLRALVYMPDDGSAKGQVFTPLSPYAISSFDLVWQKGTDGSVWHILPGGSRRLRGFWLEIMMDLFAKMDCIPSDCDVFFDALEWQVKKDLVQQGRVMPMGGVLPRNWLRLASFQAWLREEYFKDSTWCTLTQFMSLVNTLMKCRIPETVLEKQVFLPCPKDPEDDLGELRNLSDLGAALSVALGYGLTTTAVEQVLDTLMPRGPLRTLAISMLDEEFDKLDVNKTGVLQPAEAIVLVHRLLKPGLTCEDLCELFNKKLGLEVPEAEMHRYFTLMDINGDGALQATEFVSFMQYVVFDFFPKKILQRMNLTGKQIMIFIIFLILELAALFWLVSLVIAAFATGQGVASAIHSAVNSAGAVGAKMSADSSIGFEDTMANLKKEMEGMLTAAVCTTLGLSKAVVDRMQKVFAGVATPEAAVKKAIKAE